MSYMEIPLLIDGYQCYPGAKGKNCQNATQKPMPQDIVSDLTDIYLQQAWEQINVSPAPRALLCVLNAVHVACCVKKCIKKFIIFRNSDRDCSNCNKCQARRLRAKESKVELSLSPCKYTTQVTLPRTARISELKS